jgi:predicted metal-dependent peptidase
MTDSYTEPSVDIEGLYDEAIDFLDENYAFFLTNVLNAGKPIWDTSIPTAAVVVPKTEAVDRSRFEFVFNPNFAASLPSEHFAFVLAHETLHVLLYHLTLSLNFDNKEIFNIAADCVINDFLTGAGLDAPEGLCIGEAVVGFNCSNSTVTEVYNIIENDPELQKQLGIAEDCDECGGSGNGDDCDGCDGGKELDGSEHRQCGGTGSKPCPKCKGSGKQGSGSGKFFVIDSHDWMHDPQSVRDFMDAMADGGFTPDQLPDDLEEILNETVNEYEKTKMAGKGSGKEEFMREQKITLKWVELLEKVDPDMFRMPGAGPKPLSSFRRPRRKLAGMAAFSDAILPSLETPDNGPMTRRSDRKPYIVLALDTSGSIGNATANKFLNLARSIPRDKVEISACTFTDSYMPLDDNPKWRSGGTNFSAIEQYIRKHALAENDGKYPSAVVVVTDGCATFYGDLKPNNEQAKNWTWLLLNTRQRDSTKSYLSPLGFAPENFDCLDGFVDGSVKW